MSDQIVLCPHCQKEFPLTATLTANIETQMRSKLEAEWTKRKAQLEAEKLTMERDFADKLQREKQGLVEAAKAEAEQRVSLELKDLKNHEQQMRKQLEEAQKNELDLRKKSRELEEQKQNMELELQRKLDAERASLIEKAKNEAADEMGRKMAEKDKTIEMMMKRVEEMERMGTQGSMQVQGEVQEDELKHFLQNLFLFDSIEDVPTGMNGADLVHTVKNQFGEACGVIVWESKNTKHWQAEWVKKLKADQTSAKADLAVIVTRAMPDNVEGCGNVDGIWIVEQHSLKALAMALRKQLLELNQVKRSMVGRGEKMEMLYNYLSGSQFKLRVESIVSAFSSLKIDLDKERTAMQRIWQKREKEIERVMLNTTGMYGDLQGIIGAAVLPEMQMLELPSSE
jgi:hypothetical protein